MTCETCNGTGRCPCGATDCNQRCPDCYCDSCSESGKKLVGPGKRVCEECAKDEIEARAEDAAESRRSIERSQYLEEHGFHD